MSSEVIQLVPPVVILNQTTIPADQAPLPGFPQEIVSPIQGQAIEAVFTQDHLDRESQLAAGLLGLWTGSILLHDLAVEHLSSPADPEVLPRRDKGENEDQDNG